MPGLSDPRTTTTDVADDLSSFTHAIHSGGLGDRLKNHEWLGSGRWGRVADDLDLEDGDESPTTSVVCSTARGFRVAGAKVLKNASIGAVLMLGNTAGLEAQRSCQTHRKDTWWALGCWKSGFAVLASSQAAQT